MRIFVKYLSKHKLPFFVAIICVFLEAICDLLQPTLIAKIIDLGIKNNDLQVVWTYGLSMISITFVGAVFALLRNLLSSNVSQKFGGDLRYDLFKKTMELELSDVDKFEPGSLITRITNDVTQIKQFINGIMRIFIKAPLTCVGSVVLAFLLNPKLSLVLFGAIGIVAILISISMKLSYERYSKVQKTLDRVNTSIYEYLMGIRLVKSFGKFKKEEEKFDEINSMLSDENVKAQRIITFFAPLMSLTINVSIAVIIYIGSFMFIKGSVEVGAIIAFTNYMTQILSSLMMIINIFNTFVRTKASSERVLEVLCLDTSKKDVATKKKQTHSILSFNDVSFSYPTGSGKPVLNHLSFDVNEGEIVGVIGPTGSGKSTTTWLSLGFYDDYSGEILFEGTEIKSSSKEELRKKVSICPQKSMLFSGSVSENIRWGKLEALENEIKSATDLSLATDFIEKMPDGFNSVLGQGSVNISGGQKQRISIARGIIKDAKLLIIDDATGALDALTELKVISNLKELKSDKGILMITQKISTSILCDKIVVIEDGRCVNCGTHEELLKTSFVYQDIYKSQIGGDLYE